MYPVTAIGRIITCLCAFVGAGMMAMLVSVLVDRYQRVYNQKMYIPQHEIPSVEFNPLRSGQDGNHDATETKIPSRKISRRQQLSSILSGCLSSVHRRFTNDQHRSSKQAYQVQFAVSFDGENLDTHEVENIITTMREKMTEAMPDTGTIIKLQLMEQKNNKLWTTYNSDSTHYSNLN